MATKAEIEKLALCLDKGFKVLDAKYNTLCAAVIALREHEANGPSGYDSHSVWHAEHARLRAELDALVKDGK